MNIVKKINTFFLNIINQSFKAVKKLFKIKLCSKQGVPVLLV